MTGYLGRIYTLKPLLYYKITRNLFKIVPENSTDSEICLIDTGYTGAIILPDTTKNRKISATGNFTNSILILADQTEIDSEMTKAFFFFSRRKERSTYYFCKCFTSYYGNATYFLV